MPINNIVMDSFKDLEALMNNKNGLTGLPTGFVDFDNLTSGCMAVTLLFWQHALPWVKRHCR